MIVTDSLFSMDGDFAPLRHSPSWQSDSTRCSWSTKRTPRAFTASTAAGCARRSASRIGVHVRIGTLSKALGSMGGFVAGRKSLIDWLANRARSYVFSTAPPAAWCRRASRHSTSSPRAAALPQLHDTARRLAVAIAPPRLEHRRERKPDHSDLHRRARADNETRRRAARARSVRSWHSPTLGARGPIAAALKYSECACVGDD